jgi:type VI secretion system secreted protein VgrG
VYNGVNKVPYELPTHASRTTFKSKSVGGDGFNEWRFEDKAGEEEIYIHAQKDMKSEILNDKTETVGNDRKRDVTRDETVHVGRNQTVNVDDKISITAGNSITLTCGASSITLKKDGTIDIKGIKVTVEGAATATLTSSTKAAVQGSGSVQISSTGVLTVQGSLVKIN